MESIVKNEVISILTASQRGWSRAMSIKKIRFMSIFSDKNVEREYCIVNA